MLLVGERDSTEAGSDNGEWATEGGNGESPGRGGREEFFGEGHGDEAGERGVEAALAVSWLSRLELLCAALGASMVRRWVRGEPQTHEEKANAKWLKHPLLLHAGMRAVQPSQPTPAAGSAMASRSTGRVRPAGPDPGAWELRSLDPFEARLATVDRSPPSLESIAAAGSWGTGLMIELCRGPRGGAARALASAMKRAVAEDQGLEPMTNEAVWAVAAAVMHHAGLTEEASQVARAEMEGRKPSPARTSLGGAAAMMEMGVRQRRGDVPSISPALVRAWRSAQQARLWLQRVAAQGRDRALLVSRASFLLLLEPWALTTRGKASLERAPSIPPPGMSGLSGLSSLSSGAGSDANAVGKSLMASELALQFLLARDEPGDGKAPIGDGSVGDPGVLLRTMELRSVRAMARAKGFSLAEELLGSMDFHHSTAEVLAAVADGLRMACLGASATPRDAAESPEPVEGGSGEGGEGTAGVPGGTDTEGAAGTAASDGPRGSPPEGGDGSSTGGNLHYLAGVHCCDTLSKAELVRAVSGFLARVTDILGRDHKTTGGEGETGRGGGGGDGRGGGFSGPGADSDPVDDVGPQAVHPPGSRQLYSPRESLQAVRVQAFRAVSMDYGRDDHGILHRSGLLRRVVALLDDPDSTVAAAASETMQELYRCATEAGEGDDNGVIKAGRRVGGAETQGEDEKHAGGQLSVRAGEKLSGEGTLSGAPGPAATSHFQETFLAAVCARMGKMADAAQAEKLSTAERARSRSDSAVSAGGQVLLDRTLLLEGSRAGLVVPHFPVGARHTLSFWVFVPQGTSPARSDEGVTGASADGASDAVEQVGVADPATVAAAGAGDAAPQASAAGGSSGLYVVVHGATCNVRDVPSFTSRVIGTLNGGEDVEVAAPEPQWERHPLIATDLVVRVVWPVAGYASRYADDGTVLLRPHPHAPRPARAEDARPASPSSSSSSLSAGAAAHDSPSQRLGTQEESTRGVESYGVASPLPSAGANPGPDGVKARDRRDAAGVAPKRAPFAGGILLFKGNEVLLGEEEAGDGWNRLGVEVTPSGALRFFVGDGGPSESAVCSPGGVFASERWAGPPGSDGEAAKGVDPGRRGDGGAVASRWFHAAVVQDSSELSLYVNGRLCGRGSLPQELMRRRRPEYRVMVKDVESAHPYPGASDEYWEVHVPGATSVTVRFDPRSRTVPERDYVRLYRDHSRTQVGEGGVFRGTGVGEGRGRRWG